MGKCWKLLQDLLSEGLAKSIDEGGFWESCSCWAAKVEGVIMYRKFLSVLLAPCKTEWVLSCKRSWRTKKGFSVFRRVQIFDLHHQFRASSPFPVLNFHSAHWIQETDKSNYCNKYSLEVSFKKKTFTKMELLLNRRETLSASTQLSVNPLCLFLIPTAAESLEPGESQCSLQPSK